MVLVVINGLANNYRSFGHEQLGAFMLIKSGFLLIKLLAGCDERSKLTQQLRVALQFYDEVCYANVR